MTPLSTLTPEALHALVAELDAAATKGPWFVEDGNEFVACRKYGISYDICQVPDVLRRGAMPNSETDPAFIAQSRDLVPELDRRLRETEAKLAVAMKALSDVRSYSENSKYEGCCPYGCDTPTIAETALTRIANLTQQ